jgi:hypothetical protein
VVWLSDGPWTLEACHFFRVGDHLWLALLMQSPKFSGTGLCRPFGCFVVGTAVLEDSHMWGLPGCRRKTPTHKGLE